VLPPEPADFATETDEANGIRRLALLAPVLLAGALPLAGAALTNALMPQVRPFPSLRP